MSDVDPAAVEWIQRFAAELGVDAPSHDEVATILDVAGRAARASHRQAAPVACWLAARAGLDPAQALARVSTVA